MDYLTKAIQSLRPGAEFSFSNDDYSTIKWDVLEGKPPTKSEIDAEIVKIEAQEQADKEAKKAAKAELLDRLGITQAEAKLLLS